jgi:lysophospholipase L1-like esterase
MNSENNKNLPLILLIIVFLFLIGFSFIPGNISIFGIEIKNLDLLSDVKPDSLVSSVVIEVKPAAPGTGLLLPLSFRISTAAEGLQGNTSQMSYFYNALKEIKNRRIRIAHYGDSVIEGDLISSDFRAALQNKFGGEGTGMLSVTPDDVRFKGTVKQSFSGDWKTYSLFGDNKPNEQLGINGTISIPTSGSWVRFESSGIPGAFKSIRKVIIYYSDAKTSSLNYSLNNSADKSVVLQPGSGIKQLIINAEGAKSVKITTSVNEQAKFYGISIESDKGIFVDNFPLRGNSGVALRELNSITLENFNEYLDYKLIILQFGLNMLTSGLTDFVWYEREMVKVIQHMKAAFPETSFILVSVGDKSIKKGSRLATDPNVLKLISAQKKIAEAAGIAFFDLYKSMGGENSMVEWANSKPPLAMKDYTHFNNEGARKIGRMLNEAVLKNYNEF